MIAVGITGGIGSGKTTMCRIFSELGIAVFNADDEAKRMYHLDFVKKEMISSFGKKIYNKDGSPDKRKIAELIFDNEDALNQISALIHPVVKRHFAEWRERQKSPYVLKEAAILIESGSYKDCDKIIYVTAPSEMRLQRIMKRDNRTRKEIEQIMSRQWSDEAKISQSHFVITNDESELVIPQVMEIHSKLLEFAGNR